MGVKWAETIINPQTEPDFMQSIIDYLTGIDERITCSSSVATEYDSSDLTHIPSFNFSIDGKIAFSISRRYALNTNCSEMIFYCNGNTVTTAWGCASRSYNSNISRKIEISCIVNDDFILLALNGFFENGYVNNANLNIVYVKKSTSSYYSVVANLTHSKANLFNISSRTFYEYGTEVSGVFVSRFSYKCLPGTIDYIKDAVYTYNDSKAFDLTSVYDCTELQSVGDPVSLNDGAYLAVGPHQLVKVS